MVTGCKLKDHPDTAISGCGHQFGHWAGWLGAKYHPNVTMIPKVFLAEDIMLSIIGRYGGHQFGHWAGQLGDGRAHLLGAVAIIIVFCQLYDCQHH